jgi:hypothetical protein
MGDIVFLQKSDVQSAVENYCNAHSYALSRLEELQFDSFLGSVSFCSYSIPSDVVPDGLMNDLATQPTPILLIIRDGDSFVVEETKYTKPFFSELTRKAKRAGICL